MARRPFFSGNYGSALGSYDTAAKLLAQAGQAQGAAMAGLGANIGGAIEKYQLNKEKRAKEEDTAISSLAAMSPFDLQEMGQNNPKVEKAIQNALGDTASPRDFQLINATIAPYNAKKIRDLSMESQRIQMERNKEALTLSQLMRNPTVASAIAKATIDQSAADYAPERQQAELDRTRTSTSATATQMEQSKELFPDTKRYLRKKIENLDWMMRGQGTDSSNKKISALDTEINKILSGPAFMKGEDDDPLKIEDLIDYNPLTGELIVSEDANKYASADIEILKGKVREKLELRLNSDYTYFDKEGNKRTMPFRDYLRLQAEDKERREREAREEEERGIRAARFAPSVTTDQYGSQHGTGVAP